MTVGPLLPVPLCDAVGACTIGLRTPPSALPSASRTIVEPSTSILGADTAGTPTRTHRSSWASASSIR